MFNQSWEERTVEAHEAKMRTQLENTVVWLFQKKEEPETKIIEMPVIDDYTDYGTLLNE